MIRLTNVLARWEFLLLLFLVCALIYGDFASPYFLTASNISIAVAGAMPTAIVALPMTLIVVMGEIDISVGSMVGLCATAPAVCLEHGFPIEAAMTISLLIGTLAGMVNGAIVAYGGLPSLVVTIGTLALYRGIAQIILEQRGVSGSPDWYQNIGFGTVLSTASSSYILGVPPSDAPRTSALRDW
jgi:rhamnose transport system permease protein